MKYTKFEERINDIYTSKTSIPYLSNLIEGNSDSFENEEGQCQREQLVAEWMVKQ